MATRYDLSPVPFINPITGRLEVIPVEMVTAYLPHFGELRLEEAARVAVIRDEEAAINFLASVMDTPDSAVLSMPIPEGANNPSVEPLQTVTR